MPDGGKARFFQGLDEIREIPERHGFRRREAVLDLAERQVGLQPGLLFELRRFLRVVHPDIAHVPETVLKARILGVNALGEMVGSLVNEHGDVAQLHVVALLQDMAGVHHGLAGFVGMAQPQAGCGQGQKACLAFQTHRLQALVARQGGRGQGVEHGNLEHAQEKSDHQHRQEELPCRYAGGPGDHQLVVPRQPPERCHAAEQDGEAKGLLPHVGKLQQRHLKHHGEADLGARDRSAQQLDGVEQQDQQHEDPEQHHEADQEVAADVERKGEGKAHGCLPSAGFRWPRPRPGMRAAWATAP